MRFARPLTISTLVLLFASGAMRGAAPPEKPGIVLVVHGGAGDWSKEAPEQLEKRQAAITHALEAGYGVLSKGGRSLDAVEASLAVMEDSGLFDAGRGGYYTREGVPELDASIMDGKTLAAGAVASVKRVANPIRLARLVLEKTKHVLLVGEGAEQFAASQGMSLVSPYYFFTDREWKRWQKREEEERKKASPAAEERHGTVGAVALDQAGDLAAGTSTGGTVWKMPGRVGDSPLIGAGTYASNESCAVSGTGVGEFFIRNVVAADIGARVKYLHVPLAKAADDVVMKELVAQKGEGGVIALDRQGNVATPFNTNGMMRGVVRADGKITIQVWNDR
ncbi:MAG TPA: isoaspartyl peptidase/L-asparaginase [Thermoanaerobaculia bacterium]|nr:isoaspartyl peptidase/L-asparaginase [Thermoanaerobaculia bacterium]